MARWRELAVLALIALVIGGCTYTWGSGEQTGPTARTGCAGAASSTYRPRVSGLYEGMPAPPGDPDRPLFSAICTEAP
jgi:hypothetical protein